MKKWKNTIINNMFENNTQLSVEKIICWNCSAQIVQYYNENYKGKRGKCPICSVDFPLE